MPYIKPERRRPIALGTEPPITAGELNFAVTTIVQRFTAARGGVSYQVINDALGALEGAKQEFYRRVAAPYENRKIQENGDVY